MWKTFCFFRWGCYTAKNPYKVIIGALFFTALSAIGFLNIRYTKCLFSTNSMHQLEYFLVFRAESRAEKLWIPSDSPYIENKKWLDINFPRDTRYHSALFVADDDNILTPEALRQMMELHKKVASIRVGNATYENLCYRYNDHLRRGPRHAMSWQCLNIEKVLTKQKWTAMISLMLISRFILVPLPNEGTNWFIPFSLQFLNDATCHLFPFSIIFYVSLFPLFQNSHCQCLS